MKLAFVLLLSIAIPRTDASTKTSDETTEPAAAQSVNTAGKLPPFLGADMVFTDWPYNLIDAWQNPDAGEALAAALASAGITSLRANFLGVYSPESEAASLKVQQEEKLPKKFPWFPFGNFAQFIASHDFTAIVTINVEEGPDVAEDVVREFAKRHALSKLVAIELTNEPYLSARPWQPEEFAQQAAAIIKRLRPLGVKFGIPLTVGKEKKTPTRLSDNEWCTRELKALSAEIDLAHRTDIYGIIHLYSRGVSSHTIDAFNSLVHPYMPAIRYLVTEFNIRSTLKENPQLTDSYAMEFARQVAELMARPEIEGMYTHAVPFHSVLYWVNKRGMPTVSGYKDPRLGPEDLTPGWHVTPPGRVYALYSNLAFRGRLLSFDRDGDEEYWVTQGSHGAVYTILNSKDSRLSKEFVVAGRKLSLSAPPRSVVCFDPTGKEIGRVSFSSPAPKESDQN